MKGFSFTDSTGFPSLRQYPRVNGIFFVSVGFFSKEISLVKGCFSGSIVVNTLLGTNISPEKSILKMIFQGGIC